MSGLGYARKGGGEQLFKVNRKLARVEHRGRPLRFRGGMILPCSTLDGVDDPAVRDAPGVILLAFGKHGAKGVFWR